MGTAFVLISHQPARNRYMSILALLHFFFLALHPWLKLRLN